MPRIIDIEPSQNPIKRLWKLFQSFESFTKVTIITCLLIILSTPFIVANRQIFNPRAAVAYNAQTLIPTPTLTPISGQYFTVQVGIESFVFYTTIQQTINDATNAYYNNLALIANGRLVRGRETYNSQWSWHFDPADVYMEELAIELCDGRPSDVERNLDYWVDTVKRFCPWAGRIVGVGLTPTPTPTPILPTSTPTPTPLPTATPTPTLTPTPTPSSDTTKPTVSITSPLNASTVARRSTVTIAATASDNVAVTKVEFYVNGSLTCTDTTSSYSCSWRVPNVRNKTYNLQAKAYDPSNNIGSSSIVTVTSK